MFFNYEIFTALRLDRETSNRSGGSDERRVAKSNGDVSVAISLVTLRVGEDREYIEEGKKEFRHSARRTERTSSNNGRVSP